MTDVQPLWQPDEQRIRRTQLFAFMQKMHERHGVPAEWEALRTWAIDRRDLFWAELLACAGVEPSQAAATPCSGEGMLGTTWFPGMTLNYARHLLGHTGEAPAIQFLDERGRQRTLSRDELRAEVARCAAALQSAGVQRGDRVGGFLPNLPETVIAMLATASLGAIWSSCSPDFGARGVLDRFGQIEPNVLFVTDAYSYNGRRFALHDRITELRAELPSVTRTVVVPHEPDDAAALPDTTAWRNFLGDRTPDLRFEEVPFDHPLFIMYSSGTTGVPKCIVHGHGGTLLQHLKEHQLHCDIRAGERVFYFTTCGWMMWNWLVSALGSGATLVLYEGSPIHPDPDALWRMAEQLRVNVFGTSPKYLGACHKADLHPGRDHDLSELRCVLSTGSPLTPEHFRWVYGEVKADLQLSSISGGTDIISCFMLGNPILPVYPGEIQCRGLAMDVHAFDDAARPVVGRKGELVCTSPFPSQPVGFWNDPDGRRYRAAYFEHYPDRTIWRHGDFVELTPRGGLIVYGRSDATLNPGGVRIGTAEIYRVVESIPEIADSIVVGRETDDGDVEVCLFVVLREGRQLDTDLKEQIRQRIAAGATKRHVPRHVRQVTAVPYTISGKKVELAVRKMLRGEEIGNRDALANPDALEQYRELI